MVSDHRQTSLSLRAHDVASSLCLCMVLYGSSTLLTAVAAAPAAAAGAHRRFSRRAAGVNVFWLILPHCCRIEAFPQRWAFSRAPQQLYLDFPRFTRSFHLDGLAGCEPTSTSSFHSVQTTSAISSKRWPSLSSLIHHPQNKPFQAIAPHTLLAVKDRRSSIIPARKAVSHFKPTNSKQLPHLPMLRPRLDISLKHFN